MPAKTYPKDHIRNFCIIAHIDHGKSTLADRILEQTGTVALRDMQDQLLDSMELEKERGITIKAKSVRIEYTAKNGEDYLLNLIDTPGHVDFTYEVSRTLAACEGALLVVDATQGVEAQTLANTYLALDNDLEIVPVINKIDLPSAQVDFVREEIENLIGLDGSMCPAISAKEGLNIDQVLEAIVEQIPAPEEADDEKPLKALVFDSHYDAYKGVIIYIRVFDGEIKVGDKVKMMSTGREFEITEVGAFSPTMQQLGVLKAGEVGYLAASIKNIGDTRVGDTITGVDNPTAEPMPGYKPALSVVFCGVYPVDGADYEDLKVAFEKLKLNDASLLYEPENSIALGFGFRCGFLGLLHMEIIQERIEREFDLDIITTAPSVVYRVTKTDGTVEMIDNPTNLPEPTEIQTIEEPYVKVNILTPSDYVGPIMDLCQNKRGTFKDMQYIDERRVQLHYEMPLAEIIYDFFDLLKSKTKGYASFDYELIDYKPGKLIKLDLKVNGEAVDALSFIVHQDKAYERARLMCEKLKDNIPRQMFEIPIQAAIGTKIIARETVKAMRKNVLAKCYGGDITRKKKLLEKQKEGKRRMRQVGSVEIPQEAFMSVLKLGE